MRHLSKNHFSKIGIFLIIAFGLTIAQGLSEESFAPKVDPPKNLENRSMWMNMIKAWRIPGKSEVIIPAYPGAAIVAFTPAGEMESNGKKITSFYKEKLKDWKYKNSFVGHSNTIPLMVNELAGKEHYSALEDSIYDNLFIITVPEKGKAVVTRIRFGHYTPGKK